MDMFLPDVLRLRPNHSRHLWRCLDSVADDAGQSLEIEYTGMCPDMWPEEIGRGAYADVGRIQVVGAVLRRP